MTTDVDAILAYGYDLGGPGNWNLHGVAQELGPDFPWWDKVDAISAAANSMLFSAQNTRTDVDVKGVKVLWYGSEVSWTGAGVGYILACTYYSTYFSHALPIATPHIVRDLDWDRRLRDALTILSLEPTLGPSWHLAASHGI